MSEVGVTETEEEQPMQVAGNQTRVCRLHRRAGNPYTKTTACFYKLLEVQFILLDVDCHFLKHCVGSVTFSLRMKLS